MKGNVSPELNELHELRAMKTKASLTSSILQLAGRYRGVLAFLLVFFLGIVLTRSAKTGASAFLNWDTHRDILLYYAETGILAAGMTLVIVAGGIDLSVGAVLGFSATFFSLMVIGFGWAPLPAALVTLLVAAAMGAVSGLIIARFKIQPFVVTLGMMLVARGLAKWLTGGEKVAPAAQAWYELKHSPPFFDWMSSPLKGIGLQPIILAFVITIIAFWIVLRFTRFGRQLYAIGGNEEAARLSGIKVGLAKVGAFALCAMAAGLAGMCNASLNMYGDPEAGATYELDAIAAVVIGGTSLMGGKGGMFFTFLGALIIADISKILSLRNLEEPSKLMVRGGLIIIAVLIQQILEKSERRRA